MPNQKLRTPAGLVMFVGTTTEHNACGACYGAGFTIEEDPKGKKIEVMCPACDGGGVDSDPLYKLKYPKQTHQGWKMPKYNSSKDRYTRDQLQECGCVVVEGK